MTLIYAPAEPREHAELVAGLMAKMPKTDDELFAANDNHAPTGAATHSWPAFRLFAKDQTNRALLPLLSQLFELAAEPHDNLPSPASAYGADGDLSLVDLMDEQPRDEDGKVIGKPGYGIDYRMRESTDMDDWDDLCAAGASGAYWTIMPDGRKVSHCPNFRVIHKWRTQLFNGKVVDMVLKESVGQYQSERRIGGKQKAVWLNLGEAEFYAPRGPDETPEDKAYETSSTAVVPSENAGAAYRPFAADNPIDARRVLDRLREAIGADNFEVLRLAVVKRSTARAIGEAMGKKYNAASALGTTLIRKALQAANDNLPALAETA